MPSMRTLTSLATLAIILAGCGTTIRDIDPTRAEVIPLAPNTQHVFVSNGSIEAPYQELAIIRTQAHRREDVETAGVAELRLQAARLGANAVIHVQVLPELTEELAYSPGNLFRAGMRWVSLYRLSGVAVVIAPDDPAVAEPTDPQPLELNLPPL